MSDPLRTNSLSEQLISRATGSEPVSGNRIRILKDAAENYPAWLEAIANARKKIYFESYFISDDEIGNRFIALLAERARNGVSVRVIYDWLGGIGRSSARFWQKLRESGAEVRCFNPPRFDSRISWFSRDHRKMAAIDGRIGFVSGLCVGQKWIGNPRRFVEPWRDTGVEMEGPVIADLEEAFAGVWEAAGPPIPRNELAARHSIAPAGDVSVRVVPGLPTRAGLYRFDHLIAGLAREYLWLTDAYFVGVTPYVQALRAAVEAGVDVRLLVPGTTDIAMLQALSRVGYKPLLEAGIRIFEWNGPMLHSKTAVADRRWSRVGSTNLNFSSWIGNYELDIAVEDEAFSKKMEVIYLEDLSRSTEILLGEKNRLSAVRKRIADGGKGPLGANVSPVGAGALRLGNVVGSVVKNKRVLGPAGAKLMLGIGIFLLVMGVIGVLWPKWLSVPISLVFGWIGSTLLVNAYKLHREKREHPP